MKFHDAEGPLRVSVDYIGKEIRTGYGGELRARIPRWNVTASLDGQMQASPIEVMQAMVKQLQAFIESRQYNEYKGELI